MGTHNVYLYKEVDKKYTGCNLKTTELLDCALINHYIVICFSYFSTKAYVESTYKNPTISLREALLMSTHNICFRVEIRQMFIWISLLFRTMEAMVFPL